MNGPVEATVAVTYKCNSRCAMCNIWRTETHDELPPREYAKLPSTLKTVNITGGEPFLRDDLVEVLREIHGVIPHARIVISTNGLLSAEIGRAMTEIASFHPRIGIGVSIDGIGDVHDRVRGVTNGFKRALGAIDAIRSAGIKDVRVGMTLVNDNADQVFAVYELARGLGVEFTTTRAHNSDIFFRKGDNAPLEPSRDARSGLDRVIREHLRSFSVKNWFRAYHMTGILDPSARGLVSENCPAGRRFFFMDPYGDVYPCLVLDRKMGNIRAVSTFDDLNRRPEADAARKSVDSCSADCWMICNTRSMILSHPGRAMMWIVTNKVRAHFS